MGTLLLYSTENPQAEGRIPSPGADPGFLTEGGPVPVARKGDHERRKREVILWGVWVHALHTMWLQINSNQTCWCILRMKHF
mgnify:CR=1 FL=1